MQSTTCCVRCDTANAYYAQYTHHSRMHESAERGVYVQTHIEGVKVDLAAHVAVGIACQQVAGILQQHQPALICCFDNNDGTWCASRTFLKLIRGPVTWLRAVLRCTSDWAWKFHERGLCHIYVRSTR